jgi:UDP-glucose 4-epimerase
VDVVIHGAGLAHNPKIRDRESYIRANLELTQKLSQASLEAGVKQFIFLSTIKVLGENSEAGVLNVGSAYAAKDFYSESKMLAEQHLKQQWGELDSLGLVIIRPVVVYGREAKGNFKTLSKYYWLPLPFKSVNKKRSLVYVENLVQMIVASLKLGQKKVVVNAADQDRLSIGEIIELMAKVKGARANLFRFNQTLLIKLLKLVGLNGLVDRLLSDYVVDANEAQLSLNYTQAISVEEAFRRSFSQKVP